MILDRAHAAETIYRHPDQQRQDRRKPDRQARPYPKIPKPHVPNPKLPADGSAQWNMLVQPGLKISQAGLNFG
jgi:hypothetical protein